MSDGFLEVRGVRLAFSDQGDGPVVIRAHGLTQSRKADRDLGLLDSSELVAAGYRVIAYDARGHGVSDGTAESATYRWGELAEDLLAVIDHFSPGEPVRAIGISMGTATILTAAIREPERFAALALGAPPTAWETRAPQAAMYEQLAQLVETMPSEEFSALLAQAPVPEIFADVSGFGAAPDVSSALLPSVFRGAGASDLPAPEALARLRTPALILAWATDTGHPLSTAQRLAELLPASTLHVSTTSTDIRTWAGRAATFFG